MIANNMPYLLDACQIGQAKKKLKNLRPSRKQLVSSSLKVHLSHILRLASYNPGQNIWHKVKTYSKIGQDFKNVISNFACFLITTVKI